MGLSVFGHWGPPLLAFPTSHGDEWELQRNGLIGAIGDFIDADQVSTPEYFKWALKLSRVGSLIVVDNVVRKGEVANARTNDPAVQGMRRFI